MAIAETLSDVWHNVEDKAWNLADFLEDKGIPISTFCEDRGVSPAMLFGGIIIAVILIIAFASAGGSAGSATISVYVKDSAGAPIVTTVVIEYDSGASYEDLTSLSDGKAQFTNMRYGDARVYIRHSQGTYTGSANLKIDSETERVDITAESAEGIIEATVEWDDGTEVKEGSIEVAAFVSGTVASTKPLDGSSPYTFNVPVGKYFVNVLSQSGNKLKDESVDVTEGHTTEVEFSIPQDVEQSATVNVIVKDENGNVVPDVTVKLQNYNNGNVIGTETTDANGEVSFGNLDMQTTVYVTAYKDGNKIYETITTYEGKKDYKATIRSVEETINVVLKLNGKVEVLVKGSDSSLPISGASVQIFDKDGTAISTVKTTNKEGKVNFVGFEENLDVYPVVSALGYLDFGTIEDSQTISYLVDSNFFYAPLQKDISVQKSEITVRAVDMIYDESLDGVDALLSDIEGNAIKKVENAENITFQIDASKRYNVAVHKSGYIRVLLEGLGSGTVDAELERSNAVNSGEVRVCTFINDAGSSSPAESTIELLKSTGQLLDSAETTGGDDGDNCVTFEDIPKGWSVYGRALSDGYDAVEGDVEIVAALESGVTEINIDLEVIPENAPVPGNIQVCVVDMKNNAVAGAEILLYDSSLDGPSWDGTYRKSAASDGCAIFENIPSVFTNAEGTLQAVEVYPIVSSTSYSTYNGKDEGNIVSVQPQRTTPINVRLSQGQEMCVVTKSGDEILSGVDVSVCANAQCNQIIETKKTESDGHVAFSTDADPVTVKVVPNSRYLKEEVLSTFSLTQISQGTCGQIDVPKIQMYASLSIEGATSGYMTLMPMEGAELSFLVTVDGVPFEASVLSSGGQNALSGIDGTQIDLVLSGDVTGAYLSSVEPKEGRYAMSFTAPIEEGDYKATLQATIPDCTSCRGDQRTVNIKVDDGDADNDGILDDYDECPRTSEGIDVTSNGCEVEVVEEIPEEEQETYELDTDNDGVPDDYDAYPNDPTRIYPETDVNDNGMPDTYETQEQYESSVQVCVVGSSGEPIYGNSISLYNRGAQSGLSRYNYQSNSYGQPWVATQSSDNCKVFVGYASTANLNAAAFLSSFQLSVSGGKHYTNYDSSSGDSSSLDIAWSGPGGMMRVTIRLKSNTGSSEEVGGTYMDPEREVELSSESWMDADDINGIETIYPVVTDIDRDISVQVTYRINDGATDDLKQTVKYEISGGSCYEILDESVNSLGGNVITFKKGQNTASDYVTLATKDNCWTNNDPSLEGDFRFRITGQLTELGGKESQISTYFTPFEVNVKPLVGATKEVSGLSDLTELNDHMELKYGVATLGSLPYCIDDKDNTDSRRLRDRELERAEEAAAAEYKTVLDFGGTSMPSGLDSLITSVSGYIKDQLKKSPLECKTYVTVSDKYMGYVKAGQEGQKCNEAKAQEGARKVNIWEKIFCEAVLGKTQGDIELDQGYNIRIDSA